MAFALRAGIQFTTTALVMSIGSLAHADPRCLVTFHAPVTARADSAWRRAARTFEQDIASSPGDCASVDIQVDGRGASIELRTLDGRAAARRVQQPSEIEPLVRAMLIGFDAPTTPEVDVPSPVESEPSEPPPTATLDEAPGPIPDADSVKAPTSKTRPDLFAAVGAGMEVQAHDGASAVGHALVGISMRAWQLGAFAKWEFEHHQDADGSTHHSNLDAFGGGVMVGRRQAAGPVTLVYGSSFGVYSVDQETGGGHRNLGPPARHVEGSVADPRAGLYFGAVFPATGRIRTRAQIDSEVAFVEHAAGSEFPNVPRWGLGLSFGVDFELNP